MSSLAEKEFYEINGEFKKYVDCYCKNYGFTKEQAFSHAIVKEVMLSIKKGAKKHDKRC